MFLSFDIQYFSLYVEVISRKRNLNNVQIKIFTKKMVQIILPSYCEEEIGKMLDTNYDFYSQKLEYFLGCPANVNLVYMKSCFFLTSTTPLYLVSS